MVIQEPVRAAIWYALNNYNFDDAVFLAERLHAEVDSLDSSYLLATCYFRSGRVQQARHVLGQHRGEPQCELLYARCCLQLNDLKSGLLALNGLLCLGEEREEEIADRFGDDRGVAFWLLGEINRRLHQPKEAAKHFCSCLKFNPFLWTAYQALCEIGENVPPEECFKLSDFPAFLRSSRGDPFPNTVHLAAGGVPTTHTQEAWKPLENTAVRTSERRSAFTPVDPSKPALITPGLFGSSQLGQAVASSTPLPRTLAFTRTSEEKPGDRGTNGPDVVTPFALAGGAKPVVGRDSLGGLRGALTFGSERPGRGWGQGGVTPVSPSFGALPFSGSSQFHALPAKHSLNFSTITPSPTSLPPDYLTNLQSAPKSALPKTTAGKTPLPPRFNLRFDSPSGTPESQSFPTPDSNPATGISKTPESPNEISPISSGDSDSPPAGDTPSMPPPKAPAKTAPLRRSARLSGIGKSPSSMAISRRRCEMTPSNLALHSARAKSRLKPPADRVRGALTGRKGARVTFTTPVTSRKGPSAKPYAVTPAPLGGLNSGPLAEEPSQQEPQRLSGSSAGAISDGVTVVGECGSDQEHSLQLAMLAGIGSLLQLMAQIGSAYHSLCQYDLLAAVRGFRSLPPQHHHTPWVLSQLARAFFVGERLRESAKIFEEVHRMDPHRQEGMELYASVLWHLQRETELSVLAESLHTSDRLRPEALCAMATVMNTYKDHESAVKFLQRAIQVSPQFAYAHTLLGHEHWLIKDYDKSLASFQAAITIDPRHYNAWYGMAHVYYTQEKYRFAEVYAGRALSINKASSIACTQLALAQFRQSSLASSLHTLEQAMALNPTNPIPRFHRAKVLEVMGRLEEALEQLEQLTVTWPREPSLCVSKGKLLKQLNRPHEAVLQFSWALDFNRGGPANQIRDELDQAYPSQDDSVEQEDRDFTPHFDPEQGNNSDDDSSDGSMHS